MTGEACKDEILQSDKQQWSVSNKIEAEGLEWMYSDPNAAENKEKESEKYLLGKSIPGAKGELGKIDALQGDRPGSLLNQGAGNKTYDDTVNLLREDPLFVIKKIEAQQQQIADKYDSISKEYGSSRPLPAPAEPRHNADDYASEGRSSAGHYYTRSKNKSKHDSSSHSSSCCSSSSSRYPSTSKSMAASASSNSANYEEDENKSDSSRSDSADSDFRLRKRRRKKPRGKRHKKPSSNGKNNRNGIENSKNGMGPQLPLKNDPLGSAFAVPDAIKAQHESLPDIEYPHIEKRRRTKHDDVSYWSHSARMEKLQTMRQQGYTHLQRRLHGIVADELERVEMRRYERYYKEYTRPKVRKPMEDKYERTQKAQ